MDQRSKTTSLLKRDSDTMQHGQLRSDRGSRLVNEFFIQFSSFNLNDTFKTGGIVLHLLQARLLHQRQQHQVIVRLEKERIELKVILLQCLCPVSMLMIERRHPLFAVNPITSEVAKPTKNTQKQIKRRP